MPYYSSSLVYMTLTRPSAYCYRTSQGVQQAGLVAGTSAAICVPGKGPAPTTLCAADAAPAVIMTSLNGKQECANCSQASIFS